MEKKANKTIIIVCEAIRNCQDSAIEANVCELYQNIFDQIYQIKT